MSQPTTPRACPLVSRLQPSPCNPPSRRQKSDHPIPNLTPCSGPHGSPGQIPAPGPVYTRSGGRPAQAPLSFPAIPTGRATSGYSGVPSGFMPLHLLGTGTWHWGFPPPPMSFLKPPLQSVGNSSPIGGLSMCQVLCEALCIHCFLYCHQDPRRPVLKTACSQLKKQNQTREPERQKSRG